MKKLIAVGILGASMAVASVVGGAHQAGAGLRYDYWPVPNQPYAYFKLDKWTGKGYLCVKIPLQREDCTEVPQ
jgi:hypothetical protein